MHSCVYVLIDGKTQNIESLVDQALAPFDEGLTVPPYKERLSPTGVRLMAEHYKIPTTDRKQLASKMQDWAGRPGGIDELGLFSISTCNPHGEWDWYEIGGRWNGFITGRRKSRSDDLSGNCIRASTLLKAPDFAKRLPFGILTPTGEWVERSTLVSTFSGWYVRETKTADWRERVRRILKAFPTHWVVAVDVHS